jgi:hypothetical protein
MRAAHLIALFASTATLAMPAWAGTRSLYMTPDDLNASNLNSNAVILDNSGLTGGIAHFVLPVNFKKGSTAKLRFLFHNLSSNCTMRFGIGDVYRYRPGEPRVFGEDPDVMGVLGGDEADISMPPNQTRVKSYEIAGMTSGAIRGQKAGDLISVHFRRDGDHPSDNCAVLPLLGVELRYKTP